MYKLQGRNAAINTEFRRIWRTVRRFWHLPDQLHLFTPGFAGLFVITVVLFTLTMTATALLRLLPRPEAIGELRATLLGGFIKFATELPALLATATAPAGEVLQGALVAPEAYTFVYALGIATAFCFVLLLVAFVRRW